MKFSFWQQLQGKGINKAVFWVANALLLACGIVYFTAKTFEPRNNACICFFVVLVIQAFNVGVTYFQKENKEQRNRV